MVDIIYQVGFAIYMIIAGSFMFLGSYRDASDNEAPFGVKLLFGLFWPILVGHVLYTVFISKTATLRYKGKPIFGRGVDEEEQ